MAPNLVAILSRSILETDPTDPEVKKHYVVRVVRRDLRLSLIILSVLSGREWNV